MAPPLSQLYTTTFLLALLTTLLLAATLRLLAILPNRRFHPKPFRRKPVATRILIVLGSGGHTHEMFYLLKRLDTRTYTHRTYVVSSGDAFSAQRAVEFERGLEEQEREREREKATTQGDTPKISATKPSSSQNTSHRNTDKDMRLNKLERDRDTQRPACVGPDHYNVAIIPRARAIYQPLLTTPLTCIRTLLSSFTPLLSAPPLLPNAPPTTPYESAAQDLPDLILTNGPATAVIVILASLILRFFNVRGANSRGKCKTVYVESFARVTTLSLSGRLLVGLVDRFVVQWEKLAGEGKRAEFWGVLV